MNCREGGRIGQESQIAAVVCLAVLMLTLGVPTAAARGTSGLPTVNASTHTIVVKPNGHNDANDLQAAFNTCTSHGWSCTIQLVKGTYYTTQIAVFGFMGSFVGAGQGLTVIQALPNLPSPTVDPFWAALPGPQNPWPALFTFENGSYRISGMTLTEPYMNAVSPGWNATIPGGLATETNLFAAIELTGQQAFAAVDHVTVLGASGDFVGTNMFAAIMFEGSSLPRGWTDPNSDVIPLTGTLSVTDSVFDSEESGPWIDTIVNAEVTVCYNTVVNSPYPLGFYGASNSQLLFCGNQAPSVSYYGGLVAFQSLFVQDLPSTVYIVGNDFQVNDGANAVALYDFGVESTLSAVVTGNEFQTDTSCGCYFGTNGGSSVIVSEGLKSVVVSRNTILGGGAAGVYAVGGPAVISGNAILGSYVGVWVDYANGVSVTGNGIKNNGEYGIAVTDGSSSISVIGNFVKNSGQFDLYWDETGTGNVWAQNVCTTSSPLGLC